MHVFLFYINLVEVLRFFNVTVVCITSKWCDTNYVFLCRVTLCVKLYLIDMFCIENYLKQYNLARLNKDILLWIGIMSHLIRWHNPICVTFVNNEWSYVALSRPFVCQRTPTLCNTSDKFNSRFVHVKSTLIYVFISNKNVQLLRTLPNSQVMRQKILKVSKVSY